MTKPRSFADVLVSREFKIMLSVGALAAFGGTVAVYAALKRPDGLGATVVLPLALVVGMGISYGLAGYIATRKQLLITGTAETALISNVVFVARSQYPSVSLMIVETQFRRLEDDPSIPLRIWRFEDHQQTSTVQLAGQQYVIRAA